MHREPEVPEARVPSGRVSRWPCKDYFKGTCTTPFCERWHPPECLFYKSENGCRFGDKCSYAHRQVDELPCKRSKKNGDKSAVAMLKIARQLGCVCQDMEPPMFASILRKSSNMRKPIRCVRFIEAVLRHANIRDQNPSLGMICPDDPHQRNPNAPKFEDLSQEETEWQERCARVTSGPFVLGGLCRCYQWTGRAFPTLHYTRLWAGQLRRACGVSDPQGLSGSDCVRPPLSKHSSRRRNVALVSKVQKHDVSRASFNGVGMKNLDSLQSRT